MGVELFPEVLCFFEFDVGSLVSARIVEDEPFLQMVEEVPGPQLFFDFFKGFLVLAELEIIESSTDFQLVVRSASYRDQKGY